ncbi:hypothetical protein [Calothrix sp. NIES-2098]
MATAGIPAKIPREKPISNANLATRIVSTVETKLPAKLPQIINA